MKKLIGDIEEKIVAGVTGAVAGAGKS